MRSLLIAIDTVNNVKDQMAARKLVAAREARPVEAGRRIDRVKDCVPA